LLWLLERLLVIVPLPRIGNVPGRSLLELVKGRRLLEVRRIDIFEIILEGGRSVRLNLGSLLGGGLLLKGRVGGRVLDMLLGPGLVLGGRHGGGVLHGLGRLGNWGSLPPPFATTIFKQTQQSKTGRPGVGKFGLEIWNRGNDMIYRLGDSYIFHFK
jgi:hypothetical protein